MGHLCRRLLVSTLAVLFAVVTAACGGGDTADPEPTAADDDQAAEEIVGEASFGIVEWPGVTVKTAVAANILEEIGYETETQSLSISTVLAGVAEGDLDAFFGVWRPSMTSMIDPHIDRGDIEIVGTNLEGTIYRNAIPTYASEELGVTSMEDLDEHREAFGGVIYGIEPGNDGNEIVQDAIDNDTYGLGDWEMRPSSTSAMLAEVRDAVQGDDPIVFLAWKPHWMNLDFDLTYLEDPEDIWGGEGHVETAVTAGLEEEKPNLHRFLSQISVELQTQEEWILEFDKNERPADEVAREWIENNSDTVASWLEGVTTVDGEPASDVIQEAFAG